MYQIDFLSPSDRSAGPICCPVCQEPRARNVLRVKAAAHLRRDAELVECQSCGTMYFTEAGTVAGYDDDRFEQEYWYNYVQSGAGITAMLEPLLALGPAVQGDLLDVGCGFGFVPHYWQTMGHGDAVGLETSLYGRIGMEKLGVRILPAHYAKAQEIAGRRFDYVFSSEVIEHVADPRAFVLEIMAALKPGGVLVLTTPSAAGVVRATPVPVIGAILSPGFHYFVTRAGALEDLLRRCGFAHVLVREVGVRLFCWASHVPLPQVAMGFSAWDNYFTYLEHLSHNADPHVAGGALYRQMKDAVNLGRTAVADRAYPMFRDLAKAAYDIDFMAPDASAGRAVARDSLQNDRFPAWMGCGYLFAGRYLQQQGVAPDRLVALYRAAVRTMAREVALGLQFAQEPYHFQGAARRSLARAQRRRWITAWSRQPAPPLATDVPCRVVRGQGQGVEGRDACLLVCFAPAGRLLPGAAHLMQSLVAAGVDVVLCLVVDDPEAPIDMAQMAGAAAVLCRRNGGYDFAIWAAALAALPGLWQARRLFFVNDSILGPLRGFDAMMQRVRASAADYIALTETARPKPHTQSYFFVLQGAALHSGPLRAFWQQVRELTSKKAVIAQYEMAVLEVVQQAGLRAEVLFSIERLFPGVDHSMADGLNPTHWLWERLIHAGFPFVKAELLYRNPMRVTIKHWPALVASEGGDAALFARHIAAMAEIRKEEPALLDGKWRPMQRLIGPQLYVRVQKWNRDRLARMRRRRQGTL